MNLSEAVALVVQDIKNVIYPEMDLTDRAALELARGGMTEHDVRIAVTDGTLRDAYFAVLKASGDELNAILNKGKS